MVELKKEQQEVLLLLSDPRNVSAVPECVAIVNDLIRMGLEEHLSYFMLAMRVSQMMGGRKPGGELNRYRLAFQVLANHLYTLLDQRSS